MDAKSGLTALLLRAAGIVFGLATQVFFLATVCFLFLFLRDGSERPAANWFVVDCLMTVQFAVVHSLLLLPRSRSLLARYLPTQLYGSLFSVATCIGLWLMFHYWRTSAVVIWDASGWGRIGIIAGFYASWVTLFYSLKLTGFGYQTGWTQWLYWLRRQSLPRREFVEHGIYRWVRHPVYLSFLGLIWFTPRMTADHAVLTACWTAYIFAGSYLKDQRLLFYLGDQYRRYASRVAGYPGLFFGPLGKWPGLDSTRTTADIAVEPLLSQAA